MINLRCNPDRFQAGLERARKTLKRLAKRLRTNLPAASATVERGRIDIKHTTPESICRNCRYFMPAASSTKGKCHEPAMDGNVLKLTVDADGPCRSLHVVAAFSAKE